MNCTAFMYYTTLSNGQTHMCLIASSVKIINKYVAVMYQFKSARMVSVMLRLICVFLGCDMSIQLVLSSQYNDWKMEDHSSFTHFSTCNLPMQLLLRVNKRLTTSIIKY